MLVILQDLDLYVSSANRGYDWLLMTQKQWNYYIPVLGIIWHIFCNKILAIQAIHRVLQFLNICIDTYRMLCFCQGKYAMLFSSSSPCSKRRQVRFLSIDERGSGKPNCDKVEAGNNSWSYEF